MCFMENYTSSHLEDEGRIAAYESRIEREIDKYKDQAVKRLYMIADPTFAESIATTIAYGFQDCLKEAEEIVEKCNLNEKHIHALLEDKRFFKEMIDQEYWESFAHDFF